MRPVLRDHLKEPDRDDLAHFGVGEAQHRERTVHAIARRIHGEVFWMFREITAVPVPFFVNTPLFEAPAIGTSKSAVTPSATSMLCRCGRNQLMNLGLKETRQ